MCCFFCDSLFHLSHNCDVYPSDEERENIASEKNCCYFCLADLHQSSECFQCYLKAKCYLCFSKKHHIVYCSDRYTAPILHCPRIDNIPLSRFMSMLDIEEQYSLAFSFPEALNAIKLIPLFVPRTQKHFQKNSQKTFEFNTVINDEIFSQNPNLKFLNSSIFNLGHVSLYYSTTPAQNLLQLLSPKTRIIKCKRVTFSSTLKFCEILQKSQNLETLDIKTTNVVTDNLWLEDLIRWSRGDLKYVSLTVPNLEFDIKFLVTFMKTKPNLQLYIYLQVDTSIPFNDIENLKSFTKKISTYFLPFNFCVNNQSCLSLSFINEHQRSDIYISQCYKLLESK